jgi:hypothetical protein
MGWKRWHGGRDPIHPIPPFHTRDEEVSWISNRLSGYEADPGSDVWVYREAFKNNARRELPHESRKANLQAGAGMVSFLVTVIGALPTIGVIWRTLLFALAFAVAVPFILEAWTPVRNMKGRKKKLMQACITVIGVICICYPIAFWENSLVQKVVTPQYGQTRRSIANGAVREPRQAPVSSSQRRP